MCSKYKAMADMCIPRTLFRADGSLWSRVDTSLNNLATIVDSQDSLLWRIEQIAYRIPIGVLCQECHIPDLLFKVIFWLGYCNSMMNPVIYGFSSREFKRAFKKILHCQHRTATKHIKKGLDSSASLSDINHSPRNMIQRDSCTTGSRKYPNIALNNSSFDDNPVMSETIIDSPNSLSPPGRSHSNSYTNGTWRQQSCDSESASLSENQFEALRLEQLEHYSTL
ncbi:hypothetical protein FSP39_013127 [Pinctada imbricata]|uniref:Uncharacterized protein n=1 Tax=Pinctada imbricata TaxID=66713 RepID=A0AA88Y966_PINIB|nr:hypothetical protein FSP39_013127 [Pinctada imbricata]